MSGRLVGRGGAALTDSVNAKPNGMTDAEFDALDLFPDVQE